jgi:sugar-specific transcriptional regulator TrmB
METKKEWIESLVKDVNDRKSRVELLNNRGWQAINKLRSAVKADIDELNQELSEEDESFYLSHPEPNELELGFEIRDTDSSNAVIVTLDPDDEQLECEMADGRTQRLLAIAGKDGDVNFFDGPNNPVTPEQLSQRLVESLVRVAYQVPKKQKR